MTVKTTAKRDWETVRDELSAARQEVRLKLHLASMDAKTQWDVLETRLHELEHKAELGADHMADTILETANALKHDIEKLRATL